MNVLKQSPKCCQDQVFIYQVDRSSIHKKRIASFYQLLSTTERTRARSFVKKEDRDNSVLTYAILRLILSHYGHLAPKEICIHRSKYGNPYVDYPGVHFNLSHAKNLLIIAIANHEVGVDVEYLNPLFEFQGVADLILSEIEQNTLACTPPERQQVKFFEYWTAKEALLKFLGTGFSLDPTTLKIHERNGSLHSTRFPQVFLQPLQVMDRNFVGYLAYASQHARIAYEDIAKLLSQPM